MKYVIIILALALLFPIWEAEAHTAKVLEDFKIDVGWKKEPSIAGEKNAVEVIIKLASDYDKQRYDPIYGIQKGEKSKGTIEDTTGLASLLDVEIKVGEQKTTLSLREDPKFAGVYYGEYTPPEAGDVTVNLYGVINEVEFEATFHPEKVEQGKELAEPQVEQTTIPTWIKNNAGWWADGTIDDKAFVDAIQYLIKEKILTIPPTIPETSSETGQIPTWIKNNAGWWADGTIDDQAFVSGIQWLVSNGIIAVK